MLNFCFETRVPSCNTDLPWTRESIYPVQSCVKRIYFKVQSESINDIFALCYHFNELLQILKKVSCLPTHPPSGLFVCSFVCLFLRKGLYIALDVLDLCRPGGLWTHRDPLACTSAQIKDMHCHTQIETLIFKKNNFKLSYKAVDFMMAFSFLFWQGCT